MAKLKVLYTERQIQDRLQELAQQIRQDYPDRPITAVVVLKGALFFAADLLRLLPNPVEVQFVELKSYVGTESAGDVRIHYWQEEFRVEGRDVLILEDILDTGITLDFLVRKVEQMGARSVRVCCLLEKPARRRVAVQAHYVGFILSDVFVVGYGLDYEEQYRNLPYIAQLEDGPSPA